nr:RidA family protein [uncultured Gemmiger sp.]
MEKKIIATTEAPQAIGPYSQGWIVGDTIYTSGQLGIDVSTGKLADGIEAQTHAALKNLKAVLKEAGADLNNIVKTTVFVKDLADFATVNQIYGTYFDTEYPARSCVQVAKLPLDGLVEIECVAVR